LKLLCFYSVFLAFESESHVFLAFRSERSLSKCYLSRTFEKN